MESAPQILARGRTYARAGQVVAVHVGAKGFSAQIQGAHAQAAVYKAYVDSVLGKVSVEKLKAEGIKARVVSMPSWELFERQSREYKDAVLPPNITARVSVELASTLGWERFVGSKGAVLGVGRFGASAPGEVVQREYGFTVENVCRQALRLLAEGKSPSSG